MRWRASFVILVLLAGPSSGFAAGCTNPPGTEGDQFYNTSYKVMQYCNGTNWMNMGSIGPGAYGSIGTLTAGDFCTTDGSMLNCTTAAINLSTQVNGALQAAQFPALSGDVTTSAGSLSTTVAKINGVALGSTTASAGNLLIGSGSTWMSMPVSGDVSISSGGVTAIGNGKVTNAMLAGGVALSKLNITGTADNTTFLRGDGAWTSGSSLGPWTVASGNVYFATGYVGIGTATPTAPLQVYTGTATNGILVTSGTTGGVGVYAAESGSSSIGVYGSGSSYGVQGQASTSNAWGVYGLGVASYGVYGQSNTGTGGYFTSASGNALVTGTGNVGIGTTSPLRNLHIGSASSEAAIVLSRADSLANNKNWRIFTNNGGSGTASALYFDLLNDAGTASTVGVMAMTSSGYVGIGTYSPSALLEVASSSTNSAALNIKSNAASGRNWTLYSSGGGPSPAGYFGIYDSTSGGNRLMINAAGNVGIGADPILAKFQTAGSVGSTTAIFGADGQGIAMVANWPSLGFNSYYNSGFKAINTGFGGAIGVDESAGGITFNTADTVNGQGTVQAMNERMRITNAGNVGIGATSPYSKMSVSTTGIYGKTAGLGINNDDVWLNFYSQSSSNNYLSIDATAGGNASGPGSTPYVLLLNPSGGSVGIGTTSAPSYKLYVSGDTLVNGWLRTQGSSGWYSESYGGGWYMADTTWLRSYGGKAVYISAGLDTSAASGVNCGGGMGGGYTFRVCGSMMASIFYDYDNAGYYVDPSGTSNINALQLQGTIACINGNCPTNGAIRVTPNLHLNSGNGNAIYINYDNGSHGNANELFVCNGTGSCPFHVTSDGTTTASMFSGTGVNINTSSGNAIAAATSAAASALYGSAPSGWGVYCAGANCGGTSGWNNVSDSRLKKDVSDLSDDRGLASIMKLRPITYHWKDVKRDKHAGEQLGFIAQEVEPIFPQIVRTSLDAEIEFSDGRKEKIANPKSLTYSDLVVPLVKAVQELKAANDNLRRDFEAYKAAHP